LQSTASLADRTAGAPAALVLRGLGKRFGETEVLRGIDLEVRGGEVVCIIGPSGSGKSTLLRCIAFLETPSFGVVEIMGEKVSFEAERGGRRQVPRARLHEIRRNLGMVFQQFNLWPHMSALGNVSEALTTVLRLPAKEAHARAMTQLDKVGLAARAGYYPSELSGGQQQRVAIARALALDPKIMLFDEPTSSLDPELTGEVLSVMRALAADGMTMIVVSHEIGFAASVGSNIVFLDHGRILLEGAPQEVFRKPRHARLDQFLDTYLDRSAAMLI